MRSRARSRRFFKKPHYLVGSFTKPVFNSKELVANNQASSDYIYPQTLNRCSTPFPWNVRKTLPGIDWFQAAYLFIQKVIAAFYFPLTIPWLPNGYRSGQCRGNHNINGDTDRHVI